MSAISGPNRQYYPPIQNGKEKHGGLILPVDFNRFGALATTTTQGQMSATDKVRLNTLWQPHYQRYYRSAAHAAIANNALTTIAYDTLDTGTNAPFVNVAGVFTLQTGYAGDWKVTARVRWTAVAGSTYRGLFLFHNGGVVDINEEGSVAADTSTNEAMGRFNMAVGDTVNAQGLQKSGGTLAPLNTQSGTCIYLEFLGSP